MGGLIGWENCLQVIQEHSIEEVARYMSKAGSTFWTVVGVLWISRYLIPIFIILTLLWVHRMLRVHLPG